MNFHSWIGNQTPPTPSHYPSQTYMHHYIYIYITMKHKVPHKNICSLEKIKYLTNYVYLHFYHLEGCFSLKMKHP